MPCAFDSGLLLGIDLAASITNGVCYASSTLHLIHEMSSCALFGPLTTLGSTVPAQIHWPI